MCIRDSDSVVKKLNNLQSIFRKELRKLKIRENRELQLTMCMFRPDRTDETDEKTGENTVVSLHFQFSSFYSFLTSYLGQLTVQ